LLLLIFISFNGLKEILCRWVKAFEDIAFQNSQENMEDDKRMAEIVKDVANTRIDGIQMEADYPSSSVEGKMSILDMKVGMGSCGNVLYHYYEKAMASKLLLHAQSAQSNACKGTWTTHPTPTEHPRKHC
jgi:hypothetical protein